MKAKQGGEKLSSLEVHDIICHVADAVLAGGIRRAALISLFSAYDGEMISRERILAAAQSADLAEISPNYASDFFSAACRPSKFHFNKFLIFAFLLLKIVFFKKWQN